MVLETANVMPAWLGAMSAWLQRCPDELHALRAIDTDTNLNATMERLAVNFFIAEIFFLGLFSVLLVIVNPEQFTWQKITNFILFERREGEVVNVATSHVLRFFST